MRRAVLHDISRAPQQRSCSAPCVTGALHLPRALASAMLLVLLMVSAGLGCDDSRKFTPTERHQKLRVLERLERQSSPSAKQLEGLVRDKDPVVRARACEAVGRIRASHDSLLELCFGDTDRNVRVAAIGAMARHPAFARRHIDKVLGSQIEIIAATAIRALGSFANDGDFATIARFLTDKRLEVRRAALWALGRIPGQPSVARLVAALADPRAEIRESALAGLLRQPARFVRAQLIAKSLDDRAAGVRFLAVRVIARQAPATAAPLLVERLRDADRHVRRQAWLELGVLCRCGLPLEIERWRAWLKTKGWLGTPAPAK